MNQEAQLELLLTQIDRESRRLWREQEAFDVHALSDLWRSMPPDLKQQLIATARALWPLRGALLQRVVTTAYSLILQQGLTPLPALRQAARQWQVPQQSTPGKLSDVQVKQYHRRQEQRGRRPGRNQPMSRRWLRESETSPIPHPDIADVCKRATHLAHNVRTQLRRAQTQGRSTEYIRRKGVRWLNQVSGAHLNRLDQYHLRDLDRLAGCLTRVEAVVGDTPPNLRRLRAAIAPRLNMPRDPA
jgi:hypothetical protein